MTGQRLVLEPLAEMHRAALRKVLDCDAAHWEILPRCGCGEHFDQYWESITAFGRMPFAVCLRGKDAIIGTSSYIAIDAVNATLDIGATWFAPEHRGTSANVETKLLMLTRAFDGGARRVQFTVDARNARSLRAVAKLGARFEGTLRSNLVTWTGHRRDTVVYSILSDEWDRLRIGLLERIATLDPASHSGSQNSGDAPFGRGNAA